MLQVKETYVNRTRGCQFGDSDGWQEAWTDNRSKLFLSLQREYGRCVSKMYVDTKNGETKEIGWVFEKRMKYADARGSDSRKDFYMREVWVEVREIEEKEEN